MAVLKGQNDRGVACVRRLARPHDVPVPPILECRPACQEDFPVGRKEFELLRSRPQQPEVGLNRQAGFHSLVIRRNSVVRLHGDGFDAQWREELLRVDDGDSGNQADRERQWDHSAHRGRSHRPKRGRNRVTPPDRGRPLGLAFDGKPRGSLDQPTEYTLARRGNCPNNRDHLTRGAPATPASRTRRRRTEPPSLLR